jgi:hypothetical protein
MAAHNEAGQPETCHPERDQQGQSKAKDEEGSDDVENDLEDRTIPADPSVKNFSYTIIDNELYYRENSVMKPVDMADSKLERIKGMVGIRDCTRNLIDMQLEEYSDNAIEAKQTELNELYDAF